MKKDERLHFDEFREKLRTAAHLNTAFIELVERYHAENFPDFDQQQSFWELIATWQMAFPERKQPFSTYASFLAVRSRLRGKAQTTQVLQEC